MAKAAKKETAQDHCQTEFDKLVAFLDTHKVKSVDDHFQAKLDSAIKAWARQYRKEMKGTENLKEQINFIVQYVCSMALDGNNEQNLNRISYFLQMQDPESEGEKMKLLFTGGYPDDIVVYVDILQDVDLVDIHSILSFSLMEATQAGKKRWTKKSAEELFRGVENDFYYDFAEDELTLCDYYKGSSLTVFVQELYGDEEEIYEAIEKRRT